MKKIFFDKVLSLLNKQEQSFVICVNERFYYVEKGHVYCFQSHKSEQIRKYILSYYSQKMKENELKKLMNELILQQIYYDWFTDVGKETFVVMCEGFGNEFDVFFCN